MQPLLSASFENIRDVQREPRSKKRWYLEHEAEHRLLTLVGKDISQVGGTTERVRVNGTMKIRVARVIGGLIVRCHLRVLADDSGGVDGSNV